MARGDIIPDQNGRKLTPCSFGRKKRYLRRPEGATRGLDGGANQSSEGFNNQNDDGTGSLKQQIVLDEDFSPGITYWSVPLFLLMGLCFIFSFVRRPGRRDSNSSSAALSQIAKREAERKELLEWIERANVSMIVEKEDLFGEMSAESPLQELTQQPPYNDTSTEATVVECEDGEDEENHVPSNTIDSLFSSESKIIYSSSSAATVALCNGLESQDNPATITADVELGVVETMDLGSKAEEAENCVEIEEARSTNEGTEKNDAEGDSRRTLKKNASISVRANEDTDEEVERDGRTSKELAAAVFTEGDVEDDDCETGLLRLRSSSLMTPRLVPNCCTVCLEPYNVGDTVVWSSNPHCQHAFHKVCIVDWLTAKGASMTQQQQANDEEEENNGDEEGGGGVKTPCPCCRQDFCILPDNDEDNNQKPTKAEVVNAAITSGSHTSSP